MRYLLLLAALVLGACGARSGGTPGQPHTAGADLHTLGITCLWIGVAAMVLGGAAFIVFKFGAAGNPIAKFVDWVGGAIVLEIIAVAGGLAFIFGLGTLWLLDHPIVAYGLAATAVTALVAWALHRRSHLGRCARHWVGLGPAKVKS